MAERTVHYFEDCGPENTDATVDAIGERVREGDIQAIIVASMSGRTAIKVAEQMKAAGLEAKVVCVTGPPSWEQYGYEMPLLKPKERARLKQLGVAIMDQVEEPFRGLLFRNWWEKETIELEKEKADLFWMTLICVGGHGFRTAIEVIFMAVEAGAIKTGERVIGVAGMVEGADSAIVMRATRFEDVVGEDPAKRMKVEEILAMPKETSWVGKG
ncbi:MAG: pyruvate kinase alpha/beta domain-containing protein [Candidatus Bipolaricaulia bacterium]